jgi:LPXTG-motif cell wall-anchored protein
MVVLGREMTAAPWWLWAGFALVCVALLLALWRRRRAS